METGMPSVVSRILCALIISSAASTPGLSGPTVDPRFPVQISLNGSGGPGSAALLNWSTTTFADVKIAGDADAFSRATPSFTNGATGMDWWPADAGAMTDVLSCNASLGRFRTEPGPDGTYINPQCVANGKLFGVSQRGILYISRDGNAWLPASNEPRATGSVLALSSGTLLSLIPESGRIAVYRSVDEGVSWSPALEFGTQTPFRWLTSGAWLAPFGFHQSADGVAVMVEYQLPEGGRFIYRSADDGATWRLVHDAAALHAMTHFHAVTKHVALDRWVAVTGDGLARQRIIVSDDDAQTWYDLSFPGEFYTQPTFLLDYDHPTRLLIGSDTAEQVGWVDVSSGPDRGQVHSVITSWDARPGHGYCFLMWKHDDVYYAGSYNSSSGTGATVISASRDLEHWATYHRFSNGERGALTYAGYFNGLMRVGVQSGARVIPLALPPAELATRPAIQLSSGATNLAPAALSSCESLADWINSSSTIPGMGNPTTFEVVSAPRYEGAGAIRARRDDGGQIVLRTPSIAVTPGQPVQARMMLRGEGASFIMGWSINGATLGEGHLYHLSRDEWIEAVSPTIVLPPDATDARLQFTLGSTLSNRCELIIDAVMIDAGPASNFHPTGPARGADRYMIDIGPAEADWTHMFSVHPSAASHQMVATHGDKILRRYQIVPPPPGPGSPEELKQLDIVYNPAAGFFGLRGVATDGSPALANFQPTKFWRDDQLRFALRSGQDGLSLALADGGGMANAKLFGKRWAAGPLRAYAGDENGMAQVPLLLHDDIIYPWQLSDVELDRAGQVADAAAAIEVTEVAIERSENGGAFAEFWRGLAAPATFSDPAVSGVGRRVYRIRALRGEKATRVSAPFAVDGQLPADFNADGLVNLADAAALQRAFGTCTSIVNPPVIWDMNQDRCVNSDDWVAWASYVAE